MTEHDDRYNPERMRNTIYVDFDDTLYRSGGEVNTELVEALLQSDKPFVIWSTRSTEELRELIVELFPELYDKALAIIQKPEFAIDDAPWRILPMRKWKTSEQFVREQKRVYR